MAAPLAAQPGVDPRRTIAAPGPLVLSLDENGQLRILAVPVTGLALAGSVVGGTGDLQQLARPLARICSYVLADAGDLAEAARVGAAGLARAQDAGDPYNQAALLPRIADLDLRRAGPVTPRRTCGKDSASRRGPATGLTCAPACPSAGSCAPRPDAPPRR